MWLRISGKGRKTTMSENQDKKVSSILVPFFIGSLVGAVVALLLAPKSGKEMRSDLKNYALRATDTLATAIDESKKIYQEGKSVIASAIDAGKVAFREEKERQHDIA